MKISEKAVCVIFALKETADQSHCRVLVCLVLYCHYNILFASILITIDRYIYITKGIKYSYIVTEKRVIIGIILSWVAPLSVALTTGLVWEDRIGTETRCIFTHLVPTYLILCVITIMVVVIVIVYILYGIILVQFYRQKRTLERARKYRSTIRIRRDERSSLVADPESATHQVRRQSQQHCPQHGHVHEEMKPLEQMPPRRRQLSHDASQMLLTLVRIGRFIHAAQYVIVLIVAFTLAWFPWIVIFYVDVVTDNFLDPGYRQMLAFVVGVINSILNPIIYAFWYPHFREQARIVLRAMGCQNREESSANPTNGICAKLKAALP